MTRDEDRAKCIEVMARANHQAFDRLSDSQKTRLRRTAAQYLDSLHGIAAVCPVLSGDRDRLVLGGDLTNAPEKSR